MIATAVNSPPRRSGNPSRTDLDLTKELRQLATERKAIILAHNYQVPELQEVADFVGYLLSKEKKVQAEKSATELDPTKDHLLKFIAGVSHGALAKDIDSELYGE